MKNKKFKKIDEYIAAFPKDVQEKLTKLRETIKVAAPKAEEVISYSMPAFKQNGILVYFAGFKNHIGFYPTSTPIHFFKRELSGYKFAKGSIQLPIDKPLPLSLVKKMVKFKVKENLAKTDYAKK